MIFAAARWVHSALAGAGIFAAVGGLIWVALAAQYNKGYEAGVLGERERQRVAAQELGEQSSDKKSEYHSCIDAGWMWDFGAETCSYRQRGGEGDSRD